MKFMTWFLMTSEGFKPSDLMDIDPGIASLIIGINYMGLDLNKGK